jgi:glycerol-3-phosphate acyltransferase PlsY
MSLTYTLIYFSIMGAILTLTHFPPALVWYFVAFTMGGIPFGWILAKLFGKVDVKEVGSGNIGATNVYRALKERDPKRAKLIGGATLLLDALKGAIPLLIAKLMGVCDAVLWGIALFAVLGHCFSPFLKFEGGKGVATTAGVLAVLIPKAFLVGVVVWFLVLKTTRYSSLASLTGLAVGAIAYLFLYPNPPIQSSVPIWLILAVVYYKHWGNIVRLLTGRESRV